MIKYTLLPEERETIITFNDADDVASVYTTSKITMGKLNKLHSFCPEKVKRLKENEYSVVFEIPCNFIRLTKPKQMNMSEEKRKELSDRMKKMHQKKNDDVGDANDCN